MATCQERGRERERERGERKKRNHIKETYPFLNIGKPDRPRVQWLSIMLQYFFTRLMAHYLT